LFIFLHNLSRDNLLRVVIYYDDLSYERLEQQASYGTLVWLGKAFMNYLKYSCIESV